MYEQDTDFMLSAIQQQLLANLSQELPARYNGPLLHVLEDYRHLKAEKESLKTRLEEQIRYYHVYIDRLCLVFNLLSEEELSRRSGTVDLDFASDIIGDMIRQPATSDAIDRKNRLPRIERRLVEGKVACEPTKVRYHDNHHVHSI